MDVNYVPWLNYGSEPSEISLVSSSVVDSEVSLQWVSPDLLALKL